jgi:hypothetical protein
MPVTIDVSIATASSFPNAAWHDGRATTSDRIQTARRQRRILTRVFCAAWRPDQAERERTWALVSARAEGISIRILTRAAGLSASRVHQFAAHSTRPGNTVSSVARLPARIWALAADPYRQRQTLWYSILALWGIHLTGEALVTLME